MPNVFRVLASSAVALFGLNGSAGLAEEGYTRARLQMVREQIAARDVTSSAVLRAMEKVPRHLFVPESERASAYRDTPLPIGEGQTISQPYIVALMTEKVRPTSSDRVLEIGTGSGYQAAILAELVQHVYSIELETTLAATAKRLLRDLGYKNVSVRAGDGYEGWPDKAPFDIIVVTAAPDHVPQPLLDQLKPGGRMIVPVGPIYSTQHLRLIDKTTDGELRVTEITPVRFVPLRRSHSNEN